MRKTTNNKIEGNKYKKLARLANQTFIREQSIPSFIANIKANSNDYKPLELKDLNYIIPTPDEAIDRTNIVADEIINQIDDKYEKKFNQLIELIRDILQFTNQADVFYYQTTRSKYGRLPINEEMKNEFIGITKTLDTKFTNLIPTSDHPISSVIKYMNFDNLVERANELETSFRDGLFEVYKQGLAFIFKLIILGLDA